MREIIINKIVFLVFTLFLSVNLLGQSVLDSSLAFPFSQSQERGIFMNTPSNFNSSVIYDPLTNTYLLQQKIGDFNFGEPIVMSFLSIKNLLKTIW